LHREPFAAIPIVEDRLDEIAAQIKRFYEDKVNGSHA
jgi:hypothetical protein